MIVTSFAGNSVVLKAIETNLVVNGKNSKVFDIVQVDGTEGYSGTKGQDFDVLLKNDTHAPISIHWHGLILPNNQDGVAFVTQLPIPPGSAQHYYFPLVQSGTYWMHSHFKFHEQQLMSAPLIIQDPQDAYKNLKNITIMLEDFSFTNPEKIFANLKKSAMNMKMMNQSMKADLNDVKYDAYLANRHAINDPQIIKVIPGEKVRLRIINASSATNYWILTDRLQGTLIAVDGQDIIPIKDNKFPIAIAQRLDVLISIPYGQNTYPILAQVEGTKNQSGILLVTPAASLTKPSPLAQHAIEAINDAQEMRMHALHPFSNKPVTKVLNYSLEGNMQKYIWTMNNEIWSHVKPLTIKKGDRVEMVFINNSAMAHPMHFHGHTFQVIEIDGKILQNGPLRDTILVLPHSTKKIIFDANNPGIWPLHCHLLYHQQAGMMTTTNYQSYPEPYFYRDLLK